MARPRAFITGITGQDGSYLAELLLDEGYEVVGVDLVEVAPDYDHSQSTAILAAQVLLNFLGFIFHARGFR